MNSASMHPELPRRPSAELGFKLLYSRGGFLQVQGEGLDVEIL
ncbi:hypothetical protein [Skermanella rosea]|nr:hypothetical protein [Skermanella rosea]